MKDFSPVQMSVIEGPITEPQYLVYIELDQPYYWSTRSAVQVLGRDWVLGGVQIQQVEGARATLMVENDDYRHNANAASGAYQRGEVEVYWAYPIRDSAYVEEGYWDDDYVSRENPPVVDLIHKGLIYACPEMGFWLSIESRRTPPRMFPYQRIRPPFANHLPPPGYIVEFDNQVLRVEGARN